MISFTNTDAGPRGVQAGGGCVMLRPGETADVEVSAADLQAARASGWFEIDGDLEEQEPKPDAELDKLSDDELRTFLTDHGVTVDGRWQRKRLLSEVEKVKAQA